MLTPILTPFPIIETARLILREVTISDTPSMFFLRTDPTVMQFMDRTPDANLEATEQMILKSAVSCKENQGINWAISQKDDPQLIGDVGIWRFDKPNHRGEIGYRLHPDYQGKGIMSEALNAALDYGFNKIGLHSIEADVNPENKKSIGLLKKLGFRKEAYFTENYYYDGKFLDSEIYSLVEKWRP